jgi:CheY-like chemotaxis protein
LLEIGRLYMDGTVARVPPEKVHILVVEDDPACREALGRVLQREGYDVSLTADFRGALEILESDQPIALMLSDIVMPDRVNGIALSRMARLRRRDIKVVYMTGYNIPGIDREALGPILRKPIDDQVLIEEVGRVLAE